MNVKINTFKSVIDFKCSWCDNDLMKLILFSNRIEYYDTTKNIKKGEIGLNRNCVVFVKDDYMFELFTTGCIYLFILIIEKSKELSEKINCLIEELKRK